MDKKSGSDYWNQILQRVKILVPSDNQVLTESDVIKLNGLFNMVGMVSSGKSSLMKVLAVWGARKGLHTTIVVDSVTAIMDTIELMEKLEIKAIPILGLSNREQHLSKIHMTKTDDSINEVVNYSGLKWLSTICPLDGLREDSSVHKPFRPGDEPCYRLYEENPNMESSKNEAKYCPLFFGCPVQKAWLEMDEAQIYVATPASLIYSVVPTPICRQKMRVFEFLYKKSDIIIFDEADRVQLLLDGYFSPSQILADERSQSWLNKLGSTVENEFYVRGRSILTDNEVSQWYMNYQSVQNAVNHLYRLLNDHKNIRGWAAKEHFSTQWLIYKLVEDINLSDEKREEFEKSLLDFREDPLGIENNHLLCEAWANIQIRSESQLGYKNIEEWLSSFGISDKELTIKIEFVITSAILEKTLRRLINEWDEGEKAFVLDSQGLSFFRNQLNDYLPVLPESPMGNYFGFKYTEGQNGSPGRLEVFKFLGIGRWILSNFSDLLTLSEGIQGPHTVLLSGTSWAPGSSSYHVQIPVSAVLQAPEAEIEAIKRSEFYFKPAYINNEPIKVSGVSGQERFTNLKRVIDYLTEKNMDLQIGDCSILEYEMKMLNQEKKQMLLLTGSYEEAIIIQECLTNRLTKKNLLKADEICRLAKDDEILSEDAYSYIRRGKVSEFVKKEAKILIAPLLAIERGHNILNEEGVATLGSAFFLVRPMPVPNDMIDNTVFMNYWALEKLKDSSWIKDVNDIGKAGELFRKKANKAWRERTEYFSNTRGGTKTMGKTALNDLYWTRYVLVWQVIGRLVRGGQSARVYFVDAAFAPNTAKGIGKDNVKSSMLIGFKQILSDYLEGENVSELDRELARILYGPFYNAIRNIRGID